MKTSANAKTMPSLRSDAEAELFISTQNLADYDLSEFKPMRFEFELKTAALNMRLPANLLGAIKSKAKEQGIPYSRYVRLLLERGVASV